MKIFLVDDEPIVLKGVSTIVEKSEHVDWQVIGQCTSVEEALPQIQETQPDVLLTDIRMQGLSGLDLIRKVKEGSNDMMVVLLTGYADFDFAQQALRLGAFDYLLKPVHFQNILSCLAHAQETLAQRQKRNRKEQQITRQLSDSRTIAREKFLEDLMNGLYPAGQDLETIVQNYDLQADAYLVAEVRYRQQKDIFRKDIRDRSMQNYAIRNIAAELLGVCGKAITLSENAETFLIILLISGDCPEGSTPKRILQFAKAAAEAISVRIWAGVSAPCVQMEDLCTCCEQARRCLKTAEAEDVPVVSFDRLQAGQPNGNYSDSIAKAVSYIQNHYSEKLSLKNVSEHVYLNVWYFSDIFKKEVGRSFTDYITDLRIRRAKELLADKNLKLYQVAYAVGISEPSYFSQLFKKITGMTPKEYRDSL